MDSGADPHGATMPPTVATSHMEPGAPKIICTSGYFLGCMFTSLADGKATLVHVALLMFLLDSIVIEYRENWVWGAQNID